jgi:hypothetical protein
MQKWEYLIVDTNNTVQTMFEIIDSSGNENVAKVDITGCLPYLGERGWELIACHTLKAFSIDGQRLIFKRPKS